jgi:hypothetical protein
MARDTERARAEGEGDRSSPVPAKSEKVPHIIHGEYPLSFADTVQAGIARWDLLGAKPLCPLRTPLSRYSSLLCPLNSHPFVHACLAPRGVSTCRWGNFRRSAVINCLQHQPAFLRFPRRVKSPSILEPSSTYTSAQR